ncbi:glycosyltransferase [Micromonospora sp. KC723]|uniref:glycosyltransferase n=1 Tax=Micromonospora sp. KC723 TaxID=2530381 RepID=UPI001048AE45|nr:glycosyltransferase [Micromonospora sp. KC723]TDB78471.1 glycosyltransferase [Micromonospora sp. KC723]
MVDPKISVVIPYRNRLDNLRIALAALADQTLDAGEFEVVVGVLELDDEYLALCREYADRLTLVSVLASRPWQVGYARNLAIRQAAGDVLVLMDVDMALPSWCLENLYDQHFAYGQQVCVVGQMIDYDNNTGDVVEVEVKPYEHYRKVLDDLGAGDPVQADPRLAARHVIPWSFAWTALVALPRVLVTRHDLLFDPGFHGYGVEDLEWAYRVCRTATPIVMGRDFLGIHLPHVRSVAANRRTETANYRYFLRKWPGTDVELAGALGDFEANEAYLDFRREVARAAGAGASLAVVRGTVAGEHRLVVGVTVDARSRWDDPTVAALLGRDAAVEVLPIAGVMLPYDDDSVRHCTVLPPALRLTAAYRDRVLAEARRVSATPLSLPEG